MTDTEKTKLATPLVAPFDEADTKEAPEPVETGAPVSTDAKGENVELPDLGGKID